MKLLVYVLSLSVLLTGCSSYREQFDCPPGIGVGCQALSTIDQWVEEGLLPQKDVSSTPPKADAEGDKHPTIHFVPIAEAKSLDGDKVARLPEQVMRVWLRGFCDGAGNYHDDATVYTIVRPARWHIAQSPSSQETNP